MAATACIGNAAGALAHRMDGHRMIRRCIRCRHRRDDDGMRWWCIPTGAIPNVLVTEWKPSSNRPPSVHPDADRTNASDRFLHHPPHAIGVIPWNHMFPSASGVRTRRKRDRSPCPRLPETARSTQRRGGHHPAHTSDRDTKRCFIAWSGDTGIPHARNSVPPPTSLGAEVNSARYQVAGTASAVPMRQLLRLFLLCVVSHVSHYGHPPHFRELFPVALLDRVLCQRDHQRGRDQDVRREQSSLGTSLAIRSRSHGNAQRRAATACEKNRCLCVVHMSTTSD